MRILWPARYPFVRMAAVVLMLLGTALITTIALSIEEDKLGDLWSMENRPHPWPWPGQNVWQPQSTWDFDFSHAFATQPQLIITGEPLDRLRELCRAVVGENENALDHPMQELEPVRVEPRR